MRSWAFKLFTLFLALSLLLSFSAPAFAMPQRYRLAIRDLDEHSAPGVRGYFVIWQSGVGIMIIPLFVKTTGVSSVDTTKEQLSSPQKNGRAVE